MKGLNVGSEVILTRKILIFILCFSTLFLCFVIPSFADSGISLASVHEGGNPSAPIDLTGYTVTVPAYWSVTGGYGSFDVEFDVTVDVGGDNSFYHSDELYLGFGLFWGGLIAEADSIYFASANSAVGNVSDSLSFVFERGADTDNPDLIQWFVDNNATFVSSSVPDLITFDSAYYVLAELPSVGVPSVGGFTPGIEHLFEVPVEVFYSNGSVRLYNYWGFIVTQFDNSNNFSVDFTVQLLDTGPSVRIANLTAVNGVCTSRFYGGVERLYFPQAFAINELSGQLFMFMFDVDYSFIPDEPDVPDLPSYNVWGYILEMIIDALKVPLFGYFSVWDIFVTICGIWVLTWLLKLLAGG